MSKLTRQQIEEWRDGMLRGIPGETQDLAEVERLRDFFEALCDMALASLAGQESAAPAAREEARSGVVERITEYLSVGGLWNPESMEHDKVRDLLIDCRSALRSLERAPVEPVAWRYRYGASGGWVVSDTYEGCNRLPGYEIQPLYASAPVEAAGAGETRDMDSGVPRA